MNYLRGAVSAISAPYQYYKDINPSTLTGAIDVIVIRRQSGDGDVVLACSPFHVRFGKLQVLRPAEKKVNVSVNGVPIPFSMKIGDAGEAFFVFETEEDIPEDLVTSPILAATRTTPPQDEIPAVSLSKSPPDAPPPKMPEPEFLDLNATLSDRARIRRKRGQSYSAPLTPPSEVDFPQAPAVSPPTVQYTADMALDMAGYHSSEAGKTKLDSAELQEQQIPFPSSKPSTPSHLQTSFSAHRLVSDTPDHSSEPDKAQLDGSELQEQQIPFPPSKPSTPSHLQTSFPARRVVSESPVDVTPKCGNLTTEGGPVQEYSWEWGAFPQPSPLQTHLAPSVLKAMVDDTRPEIDENDLVLKRSRSVPPELEGSPHTVRSSLPQVDDELPLPPIVRRDPGEYKDEKPFGSSGRITARHDDQTKFQVAFDGTTVDFELSLVDSFHDRDDADSARTFDEGIIDYPRLMADESLVRDERLVMRWTGKQYITRQERSPLMDALQVWVSTIQRERITGLPSPPLSPALPPPQTDQEQQDEEPKRAGSEPPEVPTRKSTATSSWVRWWSRSRDITESERPVLREATTLPLDQKPGHLPHSPPLSASAPATTPVAVPSPAMQPVPSAMTMRKEKKFAKTLRLSSDQLKSLNLKPGANAITFSLSTSGAPACTARIFVWDSTDHVVVSDIDGTITKSDGLGHIFTMIGRDWTHIGVAKLYTDITRNGYKIMYLTSRAIGQADSTRDYLKGIKQNDYQLPEGPVIMSPDRLMASLHREVIMRKPEVFKMACLRDIQRLFGEGLRTPFYAGFGNRITDALSYRSVNIPSARIFTIDPSGEVKMELLELAGYKSSYIHMTDLVDQMFPPIHRKWAPDFTDFNYWRAPVQEYALPDLAPPSPALSARSDTSSQSALARLRNFSLVGSRQPVPPLKSALSSTSTSTSTPTFMSTEALHGTDGTGAGPRSTHLRQMSSFERLGRLVSLAHDGASFPSRSSGSASSTYLDSEEEVDGEDGDEEGLKKRMRPRSTSMSSMPGSLDDVHFGLHDEDEDEDGGGCDSYEDREGEGEGEDGCGYRGENEEEAAEEAFDEDFLATGEMRNVPFL